MDELTQYLLSDRKQHSRIAPETLELMGKQAANMFLDEGVSLNEGVAKLAGAHPDINAEQVKRVVEFANQAAYLGLHDKAKTAGAKESYPQFELADAGRVIQDLSDGARPTRVTQVDVDYGRQPTKVASVASVTADNLLADLFQVKQAQALVVDSRGSAISDMVRVKEDLVSLRDHLTHSASQMDVMWKEAQEDFYEGVRRHLLDGGSFADVVAAARIPGVPQEKIASALQPFVVRLITDKVASPQALRGQVEGFDKVAHRIINQQHPFVTSFRAVLSLDQEIEKVAVGLEDIEVELGRVNAFLKEQLSASAAG